MSDQLIARPLPKLLLDVKCPIILLRGPLGAWILPLVYIFQEGFMLLCPLLSRILLRIAELCRGL
jgi:hypothetical protein